MKNIIKYLGILVFVMGLSVAFGQTPPPPNNGNSGGGGVPVGGGAPIASGLAILIGLGSAYAGKKVYDLKE